MKTMKCKSCGAKLKLEKGQEYITCEYCGTEYKLDENIKSNANFNMEEAEKKLDGMRDIEGNGTKVAGIVMIIFMVLFFIIFTMVFIFTTGHVRRTVENNTKIENYIEERYDVNMFNSRFYSDAGTKYGSMVGLTLDGVISNNKEYPKKQISVIYNKINTQDEREIINIKHSLEDFSKYEVIINKDKEGFVCEVIIEDIKK